MIRYCPYCGEWVEPEGKLDATGIYDTCPECGRDLDDPEHVYHQVFSEEDRDYMKEIENEGNVG